MTECKKKFSLCEMYRALVMIPGAAAKMIRNKRKKLVGPDFIERLHLAVTEVNGCAACSYAHTYMALKQGMSNQESSVFYELGMHLAGLIFFPIAFVHGLLRTVAGFSHIRVDRRSVNT